MGLAWFLFIAFPVTVFCAPCSEIESVNVTSVPIVGDTITFEGVVYSSEEWYEVESDGLLSRFACPCLKRTCVWKCCAEGSAYFNRTCTATNMTEVNPFNPPLYDDKQLDLSLKGSEIFFYMSNRLCASRYLVDTAASDEEIYLQIDGTLKEYALGSVIQHASTQFCVDMLFDGKSEPRLVAAVCYPDEVEGVENNALNIGYAVGLFLSVPFLIITFMVYAFIPELRNLHGLCLMAYCAGLIVAYPLLATLKLYVGEVGVSMGGCYALAFIVYYSFQSSFFWLNVMCYDIWRTFSGVRGASSKRKDLKTFFLYGLYAWGLPWVLTSVTAAMQFADNLPSSIIRPGIGLSRCWLDNWLTELVYFYPPVFILMVINIVLFCITAARIHSIRQETAILKSSESARSDRFNRDKQRYMLYLKLFMVMGVNWTVELIGFVVGGSNWYWVVVDISNIGLGFFIFMIFVWKNKVKNLIVKRVSSIRNSSAPNDSVVGRWTTRSSAAVTEDTRISTDDNTIRLKDMRS